MKRQPGAEEAKMIPIYQESLAQKSNQMKAMANELNVYQQQVNHLEKLFKLINLVFWQFQGKWINVRDGNTQKRRTRNKKEILLSKEEGSNSKIKGSGECKHY